MLKNSPTHYGLVSKAIHWLMAVLILTLIFVGMSAAGLEDNDPDKRELIGMHKSFGVIALVLIVARLAWLRITPDPALPPAFEAGEKRVVLGVQRLLYLLMVLVPLTGYLMSNAGGYPIHFFGLFELPALVGENKELGGMMHEAHEILGLTTLLIIGLHFAGTIKHRLKERGGEKDILKRML